MGKFTTARMTALAAIAAGEVHQRRFGYAAWRIQGASPTVVGWLVSNGFAAWGPFDPDVIPCALTSAGRAALEGGEP